MSREFSEFSPEGSLSFLPERRSFRLEFWDICSAEAEVYIDGKKAAADSSYDKEGQILKISVLNTGRESRIEVRFKEKPEIGENNLKDQCYRIVSCRNGI